MRLSRLFTRSKRLRLQKNVPLFFLSLLTSPCSSHFASSPPMDTLLPFIPLLLFLSPVSSVHPGRLILDFITPKLIAGNARPWNLTLLPDAPVIANPGWKDADHIAALPGQPPHSGARLYSGYITVDEKAGRHFFYFFAEAHNNSTAFPLILWLSGGPGCSSVGAGAFHGHGPLLVSQGGKSVVKSHYSWINFAHLLYVDSAVGTGFSYSDTPSDYQIYSDTSVAADNLRFVVNWLARFPDHANRDIYLGGDGYAGNLIPQLAQFILNRNNAMPRPVKIHLKGLLLGNPLLDAIEDRWGLFDTLWSHGMVSQRMHDAIKKECLLNARNQGCMAAIEKGGRVVAPLYMFDLTAVVCIDKNLTDTWLSVDEYYECRERDVAAYLGLPEVQLALHVNPAKAPKKWTQCNTEVAKAYGDITDSALPILKNLLLHNISVLVYSGDADAVVPAMSSRLSIKKMRLSKTIPWHAWYTSSIEAGGFSEGYTEGLSFATVRGAGHFVAKTKGPQLQVLLKLHLNGSLGNLSIPGI
ncbi:hypothetical protein HPP92_017396 [Vanilla planifolia]|uniref:Uncharacterized protein n=1 Tax=Vanilla planifolia TaxID=51239 RepID=A0A835UNJ7_VANPL|nr:hypothetical protein HPP92_017396 [Vanilla planifolia]